jgi:hypothetical protein
MIQKVISPLFYATQVRKAGRPNGSTARVMQDARALGVHHFVFVRSSLLGLDLADSFNRYMAWAASTTDLRFVQNRREALLKQIIEAGRALVPRCPNSPESHNFWTCCEATPRPSPLRQKSPSEIDLQFR